MNPPATRTRPSFSSATLGSRRAVARLPVGVNVPVPEWYSSAVGVSGWFRALELRPPKTSTSPDLSVTALAPLRAVDMLPVGVHSSARASGAVASDMRHTRRAVGATRTRSTLTLGACSRNRAIVAHVDVEALDPPVLELVRVAQLHLELEVLVLRPAGDREEGDHPFTLLPDRVEPPLHVLVRAVGVGEPALVALDALIAAADREAVDEVDHAVGVPEALVVLLERALLDVERLEGVEDERDVGIVRGHKRGRPGGAACTSATTSAMPVPSSTHFGHQS